MIPFKNQVVELRSCICKLSKKLCFPCNHKDHTRSQRAKKNNLLHEITKACRRLYVYTCIIKCRHVVTSWIQYHCLYNNRVFLL